MKKKKVGITKDTSLEDQLLLHDGNESTSLHHSSFLGGSTATDPAAVVISSSGGVGGGDTSSFQLITKEGTFTIQPQYHWYEPVPELEVGDTASSSLLLTSTNTSGTSSSSKWSQLTGIGLGLMGHVTLIVLFMFLYALIVFNPLHYNYF